MSKKLLKYDATGAFLPQLGVSSSDVEALWPRLIDIRDEMTTTDVEQIESGNVPAEKEPLDAGFYLLPEKLLAEYQDTREDSQLGRIMRVANRLRDQVDRVVVLGIGGSYMGARALMEACCDPYHNELSRADRGSRPRMYFAGNNVDNDATQGLLRLLGNGRPATTVDDRWGIVVISKSGGTLETAVAFRQFTAALRKANNDDVSAIAPLIVPVTGETGKLRNLSEAIGCPDAFPVPDFVGGRFSVLSAVGLLPAAILGLDIVQLLEGAVAMNKHFRKEEPGQNAVLDYVATSHALETKAGANIRVLSAWADSLESVGLWYDQLLSESLGKSGLGATPITTLNTRDLHSRAQQHQQGKGDKLFTNVIVDQWREDALAVGKSEWNHDQLDDKADKALPDLMSAAIEGTNKALHDDNRPTADIRIPRLNEHTLGQLFQMFMLATVVEGRLMRINPYGQPGVEFYKKNMAEILAR